MKLVKIDAYLEYAPAFAAGKYDKAWEEKYANLLKSHERYINPDNILNVIDAGCGFLRISYVGTESADYVYMSVEDFRSLIGS